jgi:hypothetical protein
LPESTDIAADPIIVYGAPRSGTTYLCELVNQHPDVFISQEVCIFAWAWDAVDFSVSGEGYNDRFVEIYLPQFVEALTDWLRAFIRSFYDSLGRGAYHWGDKWPHYARSMDRLAFIVRLFPDARFIHIVRDGRDVVASLLKTGWGIDFDLAHELWITHVTNGASFGRALRDSQYFELRYEDLITDEEAMASRIVQFLDVPFDDAVRAFCRDQQRKRAPVGTPTRRTELVEVGGSQWGEVLDPSMQELSLEILQPHLEEWGYPVP